MRHFALNVNYFFAKQVLTLSTTFIYRVEESCSEGPVYSFICESLVRRAVTYFCRMPRLIARVYPAIFKFQTPQKNRETEVSPIWVPLFAVV